MAIMDGVKVELDQKLFSVIKGWGVVSILTNYCGVKFEDSSYEYYPIISEEVFTGFGFRTLFWDVPICKLAPVPVKNSTSPKYEYQWLYQKTPNGEIYLDERYFDTRGKAKRGISSTSELFYNLINRLESSKREVKLGLLMDGVPVRSGDRVFDIEEGYCVVTEVYEGRKLVVIAGGRNRTIRHRSLTDKRPFRTLYWDAPKLIVPEKAGDKVVYQWLYKLEDGTIQLTDLAFETKEGAEEYVKGVTNGFLTIVGPCEETKEAIDER